MKLKPKLCKICKNPIPIIDSPAYNRTFYCQNCKPVVLKANQFRYARRVNNTCKVCGKLIHPQSTHCKQHFQKFGVEHHAWKGGRQENNDGYILAYAPQHPRTDKHHRILEHRLIIEQHLERLLKPSEFVHHLNGIRNDNRLENLAITDKYNHSTYTLRKAMQKRIRELEVKLSQRLLPLQG